MFGKKEIKKEEIESYNLVCVNPETVNKVFCTITEDFKVNSKVYCTDRSIVHIHDSILEDFLEIMIGFPIWVKGVLQQRLLDKIKERDEIKINESC